MSRLPTIARLLLADPDDRAAIGTANMIWLERRVQNHDWVNDDMLRVAELLPAKQRWLLHEDDAA